MKPFEIFTVCFLLAIILLPFIYLVLHYSKTARIIAYAPIVALIWVVDRAADIDFGALRILATPFRVFAKKRPATTPYKYRRRTEKLNRPLTSREVQAASVNSQRLADAGNTKPSLPDRLSQIGSTRPSTTGSRQASSATYQSSIAMPKMHQGSTTMSQQSSQRQSLTTTVFGRFMTIMRGRSGAPIVRDGSQLKVSEGKDYELDLLYEPGVIPLESTIPTTVQISGSNIAVTDMSNETLDPTVHDATTIGFRSTNQGEASLTIGFFEDTLLYQGSEISFDVLPDEDVKQLQKESPDSGEYRGSIPLVDDPSILTKPDFHLRTSQDGNTYQLEAKIKGIDGWRPISSNLREDDLARINLALSEAIREACTRFGKIEQYDRLSTKYRGHLENLAAEGYNAFKELFPEEKDREYLKKSISNATTIQISTDDHLIPWELLYDDNLDDPSNLNFSNFWGFRFNISRTIKGLSEKASPLTSVDKKPTITLLANRTLDQVRSREIPYFKQLESQEKIILRDLDFETHPPTMSAMELRRLICEDIKKTESDITHFASHAHYDRKISHHSFIKLSDDLQISIRDMNVHNLKLRSHPVVVLNACGTGVRDPRTTVDFVRAFNRYGARGIIATESDVPDTFSAMFIQEFYDRLLDGKKFGEALQEARRHFLDKYNNPLGLLYSAYLSLDTKLIKEQVDPSEAIEKS